MNAISSSGNSDIQTSAAIYSQKKAEEHQQDEIMSAMKNLDENTQKQAMQEVAEITGKGANLNIQG